MPHLIQIALRRGNRRGQIAIFLLLLLTVLAFVFLWHVDIHRIVTGKTRSRNAGDAAALAGARWQGIGLNLVGELNLLHAMALSANDAVAVNAITNMQARVLFTAPLMGLAAAQVAAKNNGMYAEAAYARLILQHAAEVRHYGDIIGGVPLFVQPFDRAWEEYATLLEAIASDGIAAGPDNTFLYGDSTGGHILLDRNFYTAVACKWWCWFFLYHSGLLQAYTDYHWWPPLPPPDPRIFFNSEYLPLWLRPDTVQLRAILSTASLLDEAARDGVNMTGFIETNVMFRNETWNVYNSWWGPWSLMDTNTFPLAGTLKPEYDYAGADVMMRVQASINRMTPGLDNSSGSNSILWTAAAKPFGALGAGTATPLVPAAYGLVLPCFSAVRLIPIDACSGSGNGSFDIGWRQHVNVHLPIYLASGAITPGCWYCQQLVTWEVPAFRQEGIVWLATNSYRCTLPSNPKGTIRGGGTPHGH